MLIRVQEKAKCYFIIIIFSFILGLFTSLTLVVYFDIKALGIIIGQTVNALISIILFQYSNRNLLKIFSFKFISIRESFVFSLPLIPSAFFSSLYIYSDRFIMEREVSLYMIGLYAFSLKLAWCVKKIVNNFNEAYSPQFMKIAVKSSETAVNDLLHVSRVFYAFFFTILFTIVLFSYDIFHLLFDHRYSSCWLFFSILSLGFLFRSLYCFNVLRIYFDKNTKFLPYINFISASISILINLIYIPIYGVIVPCLSLGVSYIIAFLLTYTIKSSLNIKLPLLYIYSNFILLLLLLASSYLIHMRNFVFASSYLIFMKILFVLIFIVFSLFYVKELRPLFSNLRISIASIVK